MTLVLLPLMLLAVLVLVQILSSRFLLRIDLTSKRLYSLSEKSLQVLGQLDGSALEATAFFVRDDAGREQARDILDRYRSAYSGFSFEIVDPTKNPGLVERYQVGSNGTVVLEYRGRVTKVVSQEEEAITNGIYRLSAESRADVYFLTGHGEKSIDGGMSRLAAALEDEHYRVQELLLLREEQVPEDARCLVVAGAREPLSSHELQLLDTYLREGGSLLVMVEPFRDAGLSGFLAGLGIELRSDTIIDERSRIMGGDSLFPIVSDYGSHSITRSIDLVSFYPIARSLSISRQLPPGVDVRPIALTGRDTWAETDSDSLAEGNAAFDREEDVPGPLVLGAALTLEDTASPDEGRLVIFGDSDFAGNEYFGTEGNRDLVLNSVAWLASEPDLIGIRSRDPSHTPIILTRSQTNLVFWLFIVLIPALSAAAGVLVRLKVRWKQ